MNRLKILLFFYSSLVCDIVGFAQLQDTICLNESEIGLPLELVLKKIEEEQSIKFFYRKEWIADFQVRKNYDRITISDFLEDQFQDSDVSFLVMYPKILVIIRNNEKEILLNQIRSGLADEKKSIQSLTFGKKDQIIKGSKVKLSGKVIDEKSGEALVGTTIQVDNGGLGTATDDSGKFQLLLEPGEHIITFSNLDFEQKIVDIAIYTSAIVDVTMEKEPRMLDEVVIEAQGNKDVANARMGQLQVITGDIKRAPAFLGEPDLIKQIQSLPGVTSVGEGAAGFNVRGGSVDQNLILFDGIPMYNPSHVFGFLSAFDDDVIRDVDFYRGAIPAEYGGRLSSVLDVRSKDGSVEKWNGRAGIGLLTSSLSINGPINKQKTSFLASFRTTYSNWLIGSIRTDFADLRNSKVSFYDGTMKITHRLSERSKISLTTYSSRDKFRLMGDTTFSWFNHILAARLDHQFTNTLSSNFTLGFSSYGYEVLNENPLTASQLSNQLNSLTSKASFLFKKGIYQFSLGGELTFYQFAPGSVSPQTATSNANEFSLPKQYSLETAIYGVNEFTFNERWQLELGLRIPSFSSFGSATVYTYQNDLARSENSILDTLTYQPGELIKVFAGIEPRVSIRWELNPLTSVKFGYNRINQFLHLISNSAAITPVDIWQPSGYHLKPQKLDQFSLGISRDTRAKRYSMIVEVFYKDMNNLVDFKDRAKLILNPLLEADLLQGSGYASGVEVIINRNLGRLTGSLNYTFSRSLRKVQGKTLEETISDGEFYPSNFDQPHVVNMAWKYELSKRYYFTGNFTFHSGRPVTIPLSAFTFENTSITYFSKRNQYRLPDFHRLDVALVIEGNHKRKKILDGTLTFSVLNVYARRNTYSIFFVNNDKGIPKPYRLSIIGIALPSVSYTVKF
jgi:CarboxypepD_reg-like domain/TonB-dependent Receptor Plug Domain